MSIGEIGLFSVILSILLSYCANQNSSSIIVFTHKRMVREGEKSHSSIETGNASSIANENDVSWSDSERQSWHSTHDKDNDVEINGVEESDRDSSCVSDCSYEVDLEKCERNCRICYLSLESRDSGISILLGCLCKDDLGSAHKQCAETWFKIKGDKTCEICGSTAKNVHTASVIEVTENLDESSTAAAAAPAHQTESRSFWQGHRFLNFMLACVIFTFVVSWLFHFNLPR